MKRTRTILAGLMVFGLGKAALGSEAETSATASSHLFGGRIATATARYEGDAGFADTRTRTGRVTLARGVAVGLDEEGLSFSVSHATTNRLGVALAGNLNLTLGRNGQVAVSGGNTVSFGPRYRSASAGGLTSANWGRANAVSTASGRSDRRGFVQSRTHARSHRAPQIVRVKRRYR